MVADQSGSGWGAPVPLDLLSGDARLDRRLVQVVERLDANPTASLPAVMGSESGLEGLVRLVGNDNVHWSGVLDPHIDRTWERFDGRQRVLVAHDTT